MLIKDSWRNISKDLLSLIILIAGLGLLILSGGFFASWAMSVQGAFSHKLFVLSLLGGGVILLLLSFRIKVNKPVSTKGWIKAIIPLLLPLIALPVYGWYRYYPHVILAYAMCTIGGIICLISIFMSFTEIEKEVKEIEKKVPEAEKIPIVEEKWRPIFTGLDNIGKEASEIEKNIYTIFDIHRQLKDTYKKTLEGIGGIYEYTMMLKEVPEEYVEPFRAQLWEVLERCGCEKWEPERGKPAPDGCIKKPASEEYPYPEGAVAKVLSPGVRTRGGEIIIVRPLVEVVTKTFNKEDNQNLKKV